MLTRGHVCLLNRKVFFPLNKWSRREKTELLLQHLQLSWSFNYIKLQHLQAYFCFASMMTANM